MITKLLKFVLRVILTLVVVGGLIGFAVARWAAAPAPVAAPVSVPWGILITMGNPVVPTVPSAPPPPVPPAPPAPPASPAIQTGQQVLLTGILDPCCTPAENWPVVLQIRQGNLYALEFRGEDAFEEFLVGPGVIRIIAAGAGWRHQNGYWTPVLTVFYEDGNGVQTKEFGTRHMFGR